jgi:nicotinamide phosphoribosyltransferase
VTEAERKGAVACLWDLFGGTVTGKGFRVLNERVGLIYGDSITLKRAEQILERLRNKGFASTNCVFGVGSYSYQYLTRDSFGMAMKATWGRVKGEARELSKDPKTDNGIKKSAVGLLRVERQGKGYVLFDRQTEAQETQGLLQDVFVDGKLVHEQTLAQIRARVRSGG